MVRHTNLLLYGLHSVVSFYWNFFSFLEWDIILRC